MFSLFLCLFVKIILWKIYQSIPFTKLYSITSVSNQETKKSEQFEINHSNQHNKSALHIWLLPATFIYSKDKETLVQEASPSILISRPSSNLPTGFSSSPIDLRNLGQTCYVSTICRIWQLRSTLGHVSFLKTFLVPTFWSIFCLWWSWWSSDQAP